MKTNIGNMMGVTSVGHCSRKPNISVNKATRKAEDLGREPVPDETTVCKFRHLLERHGLGRQLFEQAGRHLGAQGLRVSSGTIVDATIINAPSSTKNQEQARDPEIHPTKRATSGISA